MDNRDSGTIEKIIPGFDLLEILGESIPHVVYRAVREKDNRSVVLKTIVDKYPRKEELSGLRREFKIASRLQSDQIIKVFDLVSYGHGNLAIVMEEFGISLDKYLDAFKDRILPVDKFLDIAINLVSIVSDLHHEKIIHKDLVPYNILIEPSTGELKIVDFSSSSELLREHQEANISSRIEGSLPYISPEQTGRMNRDIDYRTDFYSLGISFFQMLTGQLPFMSSNALELVHYHISRQPPSPKSIIPEIPEALSSILLKLMSKNAEDRYQSSFGIKSDLEKCREELKKGKPDFNFDLSVSDISRQFRIPQKLYGRENELQVLEEYFDKASHGTVEFCLVSGYSGVGKSVLVYELGRTIVRKRGFLVHGKFDQFRQNSAYFALAQAFRNLMRQLLGQPEQELKMWRESIIESLAGNGSLIIDLIPELELIIGEQPSVQQLSPAEAQNRFSMSFLNFVKVFASQEHPLVLFLDDLQWSDVPSLNLLQRLVTSLELSHVFVIGTYRDNEVDATHPLSLKLREIEKRRQVKNLKLKPLDLEAIDNLVQDTLLCDHSRSVKLSEILFEKTRGNPFFTIELLKNLHDRKVITFNPSKGGWDWDIEEIKNEEYSDNVVDILVASQNRLSPSTQAVLQLAASIGASFDLQTLSVIYENSMEKTAADLDEALKENMVIPLSDSYKYVGHLGKEYKEEPTEISVIHDNLIPSYKFQHDRVQQAAYQMIRPEKRKFLHLSIGRLMLSHTREDELDETIVDIVGHLNEGRTLIDDHNEKLQFARLNLQAGIKAKQSSAYESALQYLKIAHEMLGDDSWEKEYEFTRDLAEQIQQCFYLTGAWDDADFWTEQMLDKSRSELEKGYVLSTRTRQYATMGKMKESILAAYEGLKILGFELVDKPTKDDVSNEIKRVTDLLGGRSISSLIDAEEMTDQKAKIASHLFMEIFAAAFLSGSGEMFPYLVLNSVNHALEYGNSPESAFAYAAYGMLLCGYFNDPGQGGEFGKLSVDLIEKFDDISLKSRIIYVYTMFTHHWSHHWSSMTPWFKKGIEAGYQSGDLLYLAYSAQDCIIWDPKLDLETASTEHRKLLAIVRECEYQDSLDSGSLFLQMQMNFQGLTISRYSMTDETFIEEDCVEGMYNRHFMTGIANYHIYKSEIHLLYNDFNGALDHVLAQENLIASVMSLPQLARFNIVSFLVYSSVIHQTKEADPDEWLARMNDRLHMMSLWADQCKENFEHLRLFMHAELLGHTEREFESLAYYERAIEKARQFGFTRDEAMINEFTARCLIRLGLDKASEGYLRSSHYLYYNWGAHRKVQSMEKQYPMLRSSGSFKDDRATASSMIDHDTMNSSSFDASLLDISSLFKASQSLSGELNLDKLLVATLQILIENAGAQQGCLIERKNEDIKVKKKIKHDADQDIIVTLEDDSVEKKNLPVTLINTAFRTNETIVIDNASKVNPFSSDPYIAHKKPLSVMCIPLPRSGQMQVAVYLENNLTHSAFTEERVEVIKLLASQASISMENARIYEEQEKLLKAQQRFVPIQFLKHLGHNDIAKVSLGESVSINMSVLFSDIRRFTPLVESLSPPAVIELLNRYYSRIGISITELGGFIDSYSGDQIMALFAVPPVQAIRAGVKMSEALWSFNKDSEKRNQPILSMGIGVNSGPLVLGTMGGKERMQCTVLGDTVNLAARIEQLTKVYHSQLLIGERSYEAIKESDEFSTRLVDYVAVKGKDTAVKLYEVLDAEYDKRRKLKESTKDIFQKGLDSYFSRQFKEAAKIFSEAKTLDPDDPVFSIYKNRCERYIVTPPSENWQGFEILKKK